MFFKALIIIASAFVLTCGGVVYYYSSHRNEDQQPIRSVQWYLAHPSDLKSEMTFCSSSSTANSLNCGYALEATKIVDSKNDQKKFNQDQVNAMKFLQQQDGGN